VGNSALDPSDKGQGPVAGFCEYSNETSGSIKGCKFHNYVSDSQLLKKGCVPLS
jgi:hypothetical protein